MMSVMKVNIDRANATVQNVNNLGPWIANTFNYIMMTDIGVTDFGPKHCQVVKDVPEKERSSVSTKVTAIIQGWNDSRKLRGDLMESELKDGNITAIGDTVLKVVTDGEALITAIFTSNSLHNFYQSNSSSWQDKTLVLEKFKITHITGVNEFGEVAVQVEKFCCIGEPKYTTHKLPFQLYWASSVPIVRNICQKMWEKKLLDGIEGTLGFSNATLCKNATFAPSVDISFLPGIHSARNILIPSFEERQILNSLPGWCKDDKISKVKKCLPFKVKEVKYNHDMINEKQLINKCYSKNQENEGNQSKLSNTIDEIKGSNHCNSRDVSNELSQINKKTCETKMEDNVLTSIQNQVVIKCTRNRSHKFLSPQNEGNCACSLIKQNLEKEGQQLMSLQESNYPYSVCSLCTDSNSSVTANHMSVNSVVLNVNKNYSPVWGSNKKKCLRLYSKVNSFIPKTISNNETKSVLYFNFLQDKLLDTFNCVSNEETKNNHYTSNELFYTEYCTPTFPKSFKTNIFKYKQHFDENNTSKYLKHSNNQLLAISSRNKCDDHVIDSFTHSSDERRIVGILDQSSSKLADHPCTKRNQSVSLKSRKKMKLCSLFEEADLGESDFHGNCLSQSETKIKIQEDERISDASTDTKKHSPHIERTNITCLSSLPKVCSKSAMKPKISQLEWHQRKQHINEFECLSSVQNFDWSFSEVHIEAMQIKFVELLLQRSKQLLQ